MQYFSSMPTEHSEAMVLHDSQYVWFRKLHTVFNRYVYFNELVPIKGPADSDEDSQWRFTGKNERQRSRDEWKSDEKTKKRDGSKERKEKAGGSGYKQKKDL